MYTQSLNVQDSAGLKTVPQATTLENPEAPD